MQLGGRGVNTFETICMRMQGYNPFWLRGVPMAQQD